MTKSYHSHHNSLRALASNSCLWGCNLTDGERESGKQQTHAQSLCPWSKPVLKACALVCLWTCVLLGASDSSIVRGKKDSSPECQLWRWGEEQCVWSAPHPPGPGTRFSCPIAHTHGGLFYETTCRVFIHSPACLVARSPEGAVCAWHTPLGSSPPLLHSAPQTGPSLWEQLIGEQSGICPQERQVHTVVTSSTAHCLGHVGSSLWEGLSSSAEQGGPHIPPLQDCSWARGRRQSW